MPLPDLFLSFQRLCDYVCDLLLEESNVQPVSTPVTVCGDIHGQVEFPMDSTFVTFWILFQIPFWIGFLVPFCNGFWISDSILVSVLGSILDFQSAMDFRFHYVLDSGFHSGPPPPKNIWIGLWIPILIWILVWTVLWIAFLIFLKSHCASLLLVNGANLGA